MTSITFIRPDDLHVHVRDGALMQSVLPYTARQFGRAIIMPNLRPPVTTTEKAQAYRDAILAARPKGSNFQPLMTCYLTDDISLNEVASGMVDGVFAAAKLYPANATTNSDSGVTDIEKLTPLFALLERQGKPLLIHGEVTDSTVDVFDRESVFIDRVLEPLLSRFPELRVVFEHITTQEAVDFVRSHAKSGRLGATITAHHMLINRNAMFQGGLRPHHYCLPVAKRERHRQALVQAATSGEPAFFLGTDSAPHPISAKESACGCAGIYTAPLALELYAEVFEEAGALDKLENFASRNGAAFYRMPENKDVVTLEQEMWTVPEQIDGVAPFRAGQTMRWRFKE
ncbi:dihydroorotase [Azospirillaceae bacterium]